MAHAGVEQFRCVGVGGVDELVVVVSEEAAGGRFGEFAGDGAAADVEVEVAVAIVVGGGGDGSAITEIGKLVEQGAGEVAVAVVEV